MTSELEVSNLSSDLTSDSGEEYISQKSGFKSNSFAVNPVSVVDMAAELQEMRLKLDKYKFENQQLKYQIQKLESKPIQPVIEDENQSTQLIACLEDTIEEQSTLIRSLNHQRDSLISIIQRQDYLVNENLKGMEESQELKDKIKSLQETLDLQRQANQESKSELFNQIIALVPDDVYENIQFNVSDDLESVQNVLMTWREMYMSKESGQKEVFVMKDSYEPKFRALLSNYESTVRFMKNVWVSIVGEYDRNQILNQIARSSQFLDEIRPDDTVYNTNLEDLDKKELIPVIESIKLANLALQSRIDYMSNRPVNDGKREIERIMNQVEDATSEVISMISEETGEDYNSMLDAVGHLIELNKAYKCQIEEFQSSIVEVNAGMSEIEAMCEQNRRDYDEKCAQQEARIQELSCELENCKLSHQKEVKHLSEELQTANKELKCLREECSRAQEMEKQLNSSMDEITTTKSALNETSELAESLSKDLQNANSTKEQLLTELNELKAFAKGLAKTLKTAEKKIKHLSATNTYLLNDFTVKNQEISERYQERINLLEESLQQVQREESEACVNLQKANDKVKELTNQNVKLKMSERSLHIKLQQTLESLKQNEAHVEARTMAKVMSIRTQAEGQIRSYESLLGVAKRKLSELLLRYFDFNVSDEQNLIDLINLIEKEIRSKESVLGLDKQIAEATKLLELPESTSVSDLLESLMKDVHANEVELKNLTEQRNTLIDQLSRAKEVSSMLEEEKSKNLSWENWSRSMYRNITDGTLPTTHLEDIKYLLEEALFSTIGNRTLLRRLDILRGEKRLLLSKNSVYFTKTNVSKSTNSIRPLITGILFCRRLQDIQGSAPMLCESLQASTGTSPTHSSVYEA